MVQREMTAKQHLLKGENRRGIGRELLNLAGNQHLS